ncbi:MAG: hypothetical protein LBE13_16530 [Bacteroidales bacterium]|jgi:hypothetical protein|nr:hypothetical protein [Bacteroidales bacterium]
MLATNAILNLVLDRLLLSIVVYTACYILVLFAMMGDLWSGIRKAKKVGIARMSAGFKQTIEKAAKYYNCMFSVSIVDAFLIILIFCLQTKGILSEFPLFPIITILAGGYLAFIEVRSVYEKLEDKEKSKMTADMNKLYDILKNRNQLNKLLEILKENETVIKKDC